MQNRITRNRIHNCSSNTQFKSTSYTFIGYNFTAKISEIKVPCFQVSNGNKNTFDHEPFYQSNIKRLLNLNPEDCKNELKRLQITTNKGRNRQLVNF